MIKGNATQKDRTFAASVIGPGETLLGAWRISEDALCSIMADRVKCDPKNGKFDCCHTCMFCVPLCWPCAIRDYRNQWNEDAAHSGERLSLPTYIYRSQLYLLTDVNFYVHVDTSRLEAMEFPSWYDMATEYRIYPRSVSVPLAHIGNPAYPLAHLRAPPASAGGNYIDVGARVMPSPASMEELMPRKAASTKLYGPLSADVSPSDKISAMHFAVPCGTLMRPEELPQGLMETMMTAHSKERAMKENRWDVSPALTGGMNNLGAPPPGLECLATVNADLAHYHSTVADLVLPQVVWYRRPHFLMWLWFEDSELDEALRLITDTARAAGAFSAVGATAPQCQRMG
ncbi:hypothetical protein CYMTET_18886 [Cymbomonas tetramitiformis]|uniref:Uncharacterized protein n=1 Tax=Cymbomonas tetramitiformis TaxID=36881 RepID=A0AAE0L5R2_9CHLO|nr:hypothetical protein CYMTET_18886 [Cymbomonas tetramitiformis]|eukprot:gene10615-12554_t